MCVYIYIHIYIYIYFLNVFTVIDILGIHMQTSNATMLFPIQRCCAYKLYISLNFQAVIDILGIHMVA